jgi:predicted DNA-binding transcriptional regulator AlpA
VENAELSMPKSRIPLAAVRPRTPTPRLALSIPEFCEAHGISEGFFYKLKKQGEGPREMKVGARTLITLESAAEWRRKRENRHGRPQSISPNNVQSQTDAACGRHADQHAKNRAPVKKGDLHG